MGRGERVGGRVGFALKGAWVGGIVGFCFAMVLWAHLIKEILGLGVRPEPKHT